MRILDRADIPYAIALGNHDTGAVGEFSGSAAPGNVNANLRNTHKFNYFPGQPVPVAKGGLKEQERQRLLHVPCRQCKLDCRDPEFCAREAAAQWMDRVLKEHPITMQLSLHYHLTGRGEIATNNTGYGDMNVVDIFEKYIRPNKMC